MFLVRHGQTTWNKEQVFRGTIDVPLNEQGFAEAEAVRKALDKEPISFIYSSSLSRAVQTARPLAEAKGIEVAMHSGFNDMDFGQWQGRKLEQVQAEEPELFRVWVEQPHECEIPGGETLVQVQRRAIDAWWEVARKHPDRTGLVASHRVVCKLLVLGLMGLGPEKFWDIYQGTAAINLFIMDDNHAVTYLVNDTCHLADLAEGRVTADF